MSIPSSSELVATRHGSLPCLSSSSTSSRSSRESEPWWARAISTACGPVGGVPMTRVWLPAEPPPSSAGIGASASAISRRSSRSRRSRAVSGSSSQRASTSSSGSPRPASRRASSSRCSASSLSRSASRSAERRELTKTIVDRCASTRSRISGYIAGQIELRVASPPRTGCGSSGSPSSRAIGSGSARSSSRTPSGTSRTRGAASPPDGPVGSSGSPPVFASAPVAGRAPTRSSSVIDSTGTWIRRSIRFFSPVSTIRQLRCGPTRNRPISSSGFCVADRPIRCICSPVHAPGRSVGSSSRSAVSRSSVSARWLPRLVPATAWISSTITVSTPVSISRAPEVSIRNSDSGVVIRTSGGRRRIAARSRCGVSPVRSPTVISGASPGRPGPSTSSNSDACSAAAAAAIPASGARRLRSTSWLSAFSGET